MKLLFSTALAILFSAGVQASSLEEYMVYPSDYVDGKPVSDYINTWWQWTYSMPTESSPVLDETGEMCDAGQRGAVWFLAGGYGTSKINRNCKIPEDKYIFFPVINMLYRPRKEDAVTCDYAKKQAALNNDHLFSIEVSLDSITAWNPANTRIASENCFDLLGLVPEEDNPPKIYPAATDGYWVMLRPLSKGTHILKFSAKYNREKGAYSKMAQDIEYQLTIESAGGEE